MKSPNVYTFRGPVIKLTLSRTYYFALLRCIAEVRDETLFDDYYAEKLDLLLSRIVSTAEKNDENMTRSILLDRLLTVQIQDVLHDYSELLPYWELAEVLTEKFEHIRYLFPDLSSSKDGDPID